jgi:hypothetical protein
MHGVQSIPAAQIQDGANGDFFGGKTSVFSILHCRVVAWMIAARRGEFSANLAFIAEKAR